MAPFESWCGRGRRGVWRATVHWHGLRNPEQIAQVCTGHDYWQPGKPKIEWDDPQAKDALVSAPVNDANALVAALHGPDLDEPAASAVALLALVAGHGAEPAEGSDGRDGRWRIARKVRPG